MKSSIILKSRYRITKLYREDLVSFNYYGFDIENKSSILIDQYKREYLTSSLINKLIKATEKLISIKHPNILQAIDYYYDGKLFYVIYQEKQKLIPLEDFLKKEPAPNLKRLWKQTTEIIEAVIELEKNNIFHGYLNINSVLVNENQQIQLSKVYLHFLVYRSIIKDIDVIDYCIFYPPEFLQNQKYNIKSDVYSFGILLYVLYSHHWPYKFTSDINTLKKELLQKPAPFKKFSPLVPDKLGKIISYCILKNEKNRIASFKNFIDMYRNPENINLTLKSKIEKSENILIEIKKSLHNMKVSNLRRKLKYGFLCFFLGISLGLSYHLYYKYLRGIPDRIVPDVVSLNEAEAFRILKENKLNSTVVGNRYHPFIPKGYVISTRPPAGRLVKQYRAVKLFLSEGTKKFLVPDLIGRNIEQAKIIIPEYINMEVEDFIYSAQHQKGIILKQTPTPNILINVSENITVCVSKGFPVTMFVSKVPSGFFQNKSHLRKVNISFSILENWLPQEVTIYYSFKGKSEKIYSQFHFPNDQVNVAFELENKGDIEIYFDGELGFREQISDKLMPIPEKIITNNETAISRI